MNPLWAVVYVLSYFRRLDNVTAPLIRAAMAPTLDEAHAHITEALEAIR